MKMEAIGSSETLVITYKTMMYHNPKTTLNISTAVRTSTIINLWMSHRGPVVFMEGADTKAYKYTLPYEALVGSRSAQSGLLR